MTQRTTMLGAIALTIAACATAADTDRASKDLEKALAGRTAGQPTDCISTMSADGPRIVDDRTLLYGSGRTIWRTTIEACPSLRPGDILIVEMHGSQLCRNDLFRTTEPGAVIPGPYCRMGHFVPYTRPTR
ncbi:MAG: hypothetical protein V4472_27600 [Pseudomonadota bacterium]